MYIAVAPDCFSGSVSDVHVIIHRCPFIGSGVQNNILRTAYEEVVLLLVDKCNIFCTAKFEFRER
jgi:hypothetical protein